MVVCFFKRKTAYGSRIRDWSSDVCSSDLGHDRRQHRRAGRHFDHRHRGPVAAADGGQRRTQRDRDVVALAAALATVDQIDLQVAEIGAGAQVVLPHQAVEVDRRGGAGVALVVQYLRHLVEQRGQPRSEEHTSEITTRMGDPYAVGSLKYKYT